MSEGDGDMDIVQLKNWFEKRVSYLEDKSRSQEDKIDKLMTELENIKCAINYQDQETNINQDPDEELMDFLYPDIKINELQVQAEPNDNQVQGPSNVDVNDISSRNPVVQLGVRCINTSPNSSTENLDDHDNDSDQTKEFIIPKAKETFQRNTDLKLHSKTDTVFKNRLSLPSKKYNVFTCPDCSKSFPKLADLRRHSKSVHHQCTFCSQKFSLRIHLKQHELIAHKYKLNQNQSSNSQPEALYLPNFEEDQTTQEEVCWEYGTADKPFKCTLCQKSFKMKKHIKAHHFTHTGERPFPCSVCSKSFLSSSDLVRHIRIHTGEKPFECPTCQRRFSQNTTLRTHQQTHRGNTEFQTAFSNL